MPPMDEAALAARAARAEERRRQMAEMDAAIAALDIDVTGSRRGMTGMPSAAGGGADAAGEVVASHAIENARRFLWDEDDTNLISGAGEGGPAPPLLSSPDIANRPEPPGGDGLGGNNLPPADLISPLSDGTENRPAIQSRRSRASRRNSRASRSSSLDNSHSSENRSIGSGSVVLEALQKTMADFDPDYSPNMRAGGSRSVDGDWAGQYPRDGLDYAVSSSGPSMPGYMANVYGDEDGDLRASGGRGGAGGGGIFNRFANALVHLSSEIRTSMSRLSSPSKDDDEMYFGSNIAPRRMSGSSASSNPLDYSDAVKRLTSKTPRRGRRRNSQPKHFSYGGSDPDQHDGVFSRCCESCQDFISRRKGALLLLTALTLFGLAIATVYELFNDSSASARTSVAAPPPQPQPTAPSSLDQQDTDTAQILTSGAGNGISAIHPDVPSDPEAATRMGLIYQRIIQSGLSRGGDLDNESSAQHKALKWISYIDEAQLDPKDHGMLQRYSLAVFFFSTFLSEDIADVEVVKIVESKPVTVLGDGWKDRTNWMTRKGYCSWQGVQCSHRYGTPPTITRYDGNEGVTILNLTANSIEGTIPREIKGLGDLRVLDLGKNLIEGTLPSELGHLEALQMLYLDGNGIGGEIPKSMGNLASCTHMDMNNNYLSGRIPESFAGLYNLRLLSLYKNSLTGTLPSLASITNLQELYIDSNYITGDIPSTFGSLTSLVDLRLGNNELTGSLPSSIFKLQSLRTFYAENNFLSGTLPTSMGKANALRELHLYSNRIDGSIPAEIGGMSALAVLYLDDNELEEEIPGTIGQCTQLVELYLHDNHLTGQISEELSKLTQLRNLRVNDNELDGPIPSQLGSLTLLDHIYLHNNNLSGPIPAELGALVELQKIRIYGNSLSGTVPTELCKLKERKLVELQGDCAGTNPQLECSCCTRCP